MRRATDGLAALAVLAAVLSACAQTPAVDGKLLDRHLCEAADLPFAFMEQTRGDFSADDLGGLSSDPETRKRDYRAAGMVGGRFVFWKEQLPRPPFASPVNVVCQAIQFETAEQARAWLEQSPATGQAVRDSGMLWAPDGGGTARELPFDGDGRLFELEAEEGDARVRLWALHELRGPLVVSVFAGDRDGRASPEFALAIAAARDRRIGEDATSASR
ncbi:hypothetical protein [Tepidiforma sp.]|uniref:hypothetical protein n=1 Tax=Tepidiforma sp. TaxID=2682230 RepID=UPI002ADE4EAE|nr:hypothetical protein [Tepidiforma sp.]